jgi:hypothetical protein
MHKIRNFHEGHSTVGECQGSSRLVAGERHGMCESAFNTAWERHGMCESAFNTAWERHGMCESSFYKSLGVKGLRIRGCSAKLRCGVAAREFQLIFNFTHTHCATHS